MNSNFETLPEQIKAKILKIQETFNNSINEHSPEKNTMIFSSDGLEDNRKVVFKLVELEENKRRYVFDYLAW